MSYEAFREQCAKICDNESEACTAYSGKHRAASCATKIRALPLPEVKQEPVLFQYRVSSEWSIREQWTRWAECGEIAYYDFIKLSKKFPDAYQVRALYDFPPDAEALRKENEQLRELLESVANGLRWYQDEHPEHVLECDHKILERIDEALKGSSL